VAVLNFSKTDQQKPTTELARYYTQFIIMSMSIDAVVLDRMQNLVESTNCDRDCWVGIGQSTPPPPLLCNHCPDSSMLSGVISYDVWKRLNKEYEHTHT
jgi:hypothetical protein